MPRFKTAIININRNITYFQQWFNEQKDHWNREYKQLESEIKFKAEAITRSLIGEPNKELSNDKKLRYGKNGQARG